MFSGFPPMTTVKIKKNAFIPARKHIQVTAGESLRIIREWQKLSQNDLAKKSRLPQATISAIENNHIKLGVERAKRLAAVLKCHPAVLLFPELKDKLA